MKPNIMHAYCVFCDEHNLTRICVTPEQVNENLDKMFMAMMMFRVEQIDKIAQRCPHCKGTGKTTDGMTKRHFGYEEKDGDV